MASYRGHLMLSTPLGVAYGALPLLQGELEWGPAFLGAGLCTLGGLLPDLDSDNSFPVRELFGLLAALIPACMYETLSARGLNFEQLLVVLGGLYLFIRYVLSDTFRQYTVHRGMFHSLPALLIVGEVIYLGYPSSDPWLRLYLSGAAMIGFLSHLILDELYAVDFNGVRLRFNRYSGSALKVTSPSWLGMLVCYTLFFGLSFLVWLNGLPDWSRPPTWLAWVK